jgi:hypothetical protein
MSLLRNTTSGEPELPPVGLSRLLLSCQFDFHRKIWSLGILNNPQDAQTKLRIFSREVARKTILSDPSI